MKHDPMMRAGDAPPPEGSLFALGMHRTNDRETSIEAAKKVSTKAGTQRMIALNAFRAYPEGLTDEELAFVTGIYQNSIGKRRTELVRAGWLQDAHIRRMSTRGCLMIVWQLKKDEEEQ
jgi:hypothetical protein